MLEPARAYGLVAVGRLLLDGGANVHERLSTEGRTPLNCATACASAGSDNESLLALLDVERGAIPEVQDLYMVGSARNAAKALRLLLAYTPEVPGTARMALAAPISKRDTESVRILLGSSPL